MNILKKYANMGIYIYIYIYPLLSFKKNFIFLRKFFQYFILLFIYFPFLFFLIYCSETMLDSQNQNIYLEEAI